MKGQAKTTKGHMFVHLSFNIDKDQLFKKKNKRNKCKMKYNCIFRNFFRRNTDNNDLPNRSYKP